MNLKKILRIFDALNNHRSNGIVDECRGEKKIKKVNPILDTDGLKEGYTEVFTGIEWFHPCGVVNEDRTEFIPYEGDWVTGDLFGSEEEFAEALGCEVDEVQYSCNSTYEEGYYYRPGKNLSTTILNCNPDDIEEEDGKLRIAYKYIQDLEDQEPSDGVWWFIPRAFE